MKNWAKNKLLEDKFYDFNITEKTREKRKKTVGNVDLYDMLEYNATATNPLSESGRHKDLDKYWLSELFVV